MPHCWVQGDVGLWVPAQCDTTQHCSRMGSTWLCPAGKPLWSSLQLPWGTQPANTEAQVRRGSAGIPSALQNCDAPNPQHRISEMSLLCAELPPADPTRGTWLVSSKNEFRACLDLLVFTFLLCPDLGAELWVILTSPRPAPQRGAQLWVTAHFSSSGCC